MPAPQPAGLLTVRLAGWLAAAPAAQSPICIQAALTAQGFCSKPQFQALGSGRSVASHLVLPRRLKLSSYTARCMLKAGFPNHFALALPAACTKSFCLCLAGSPVPLPFFLPCARSSSDPRGFQFLNNYFNFGTAWCCFYGTKWYSLKTVVR